VVADIANKTITLRHIPGPLGVRGRNSNNALIWDRLNWRPSQPLSAGLAMTYAWIDRQVLNLRGRNEALAPTVGRQLEVAAAE
jgi:hypothetical protein